MYLVGDVPLKARRLVDVTYECLMLGIEQAKPGNAAGRYRRGDPAPCRGAPLWRGARILRPWPGPPVPRCARSGPCRRAGTGPELRPGMFFTIEPMINLGKPPVKLLDDGWTAVTRDRSLSAQFEHSIGITEDGCEIFTLSPEGAAQTFVQCETRCSPLLAAC
jgi:methionyl aminopeptidase